MCYSCKWKGGYWGMVGLKIPSSTVVKNELIYCQLTKTNLPPKRNIIKTFNFLSKKFNLKTNKTETNFNLTKIFPPEDVLWWMKWLAGNTSDRLLRRCKCSMRPPSTSQRRTRLASTENKIEDSFTNHIIICSCC